MDPQPAICDGVLDLGKEDTSKPIKVAAWGEPGHVTKLILPKGFEFKSVLHSRGVDAGFNIKAGGHGFVFYGNYESRKVEMLTLLSTDGKMIVLQVCFLGDVSHLRTKYVAMSEPVADGQPIKPMGSWLSVHGFPLVIGSAVPNVKRTFIATFTEDTKAYATEDERDVVIPKGSKAFVTEAALKIGYNITGVVFPDGTVCDTVGFIPSKSPKKK
jgi:hypothetical protein